MKHIDVIQVARSGGGDDAARAHLRRCPSCRRAVDALLEAERRLGGNSEVLSVVEREAMLARVLETTTTAPATAREETQAGATSTMGERLRRFLQRGWPVAIPAAVAAILLLWPRVEQDGDGFVTRSTGGGVDVPVTLFCVSQGGGEAAHPASTTTPCAMTDALVLRVHLPAAATVHVVAHGLNGDPPPAQGTPVAGGVDVVLEESWRHGTGAEREDDPASLTVIACRGGCDRATAIKRAGDPAGDVAGVWHIVVPWTAP